MKIRALRNLGRGWPKALKEGEEVAVDDDFGQQLLTHGLAELLSQPVKAVPKKPAVQAVPPKEEKKKESVSD